MDAVEALKEQVIALNKQVAALTTQRNPQQLRRQPASLQCFCCYQLGHEQRNCPNPTMLLMRKKRIYSQ